MSDNVWPKIIRPAGAAKKRTCIPVQSSSAPAALVRKRNRAADPCSPFHLVNRARNSDVFSKVSREQHQPVTREDLSQLTGGECDSAGNISSDSSECSAVLAHVSYLLRRGQHELCAAGRSWEREPHRTANRGSASNCRVGGRGEPLLRADDRQRQHAVLEQPG